MTHSRIACGGRVSLRGAGRARILRAVLRIMAPLTLVACVDEPTEIVVVVQTTLSVPSEIDAIRIDVVEPDGERKTAMLALDAPLGLPGRLGLTHTRGALGPVEVTATALSSGAPVVSQRARVAFVAKQSRMLELVLLPSCIDVPCEGETTCDAGRCVSIDRGVLPVWRGAAPSFDAGARDVGPRDVSAPDAGPAVDADPCDRLRRLPPRPAVADVPTSDAPLFFATRTFDFGTRLRPGDACPYMVREVASPRGALELGYDIDGVRSEPGTAIECSPRNPMLGPGADGCGGVDNVIGQSVYAPLASFFGCQLAQLGDDIDRGAGGFLIWVRGWNGTSEDPRVEVAMVPASYGARAASFADAGIGPECPESPAPTPSPTERLAWDGTDVWYGIRPEPGQLGFWDCGTHEPFTRDQDAYVTGGLLVSVVRRVVPVRLGRCVLVPLNNPVLTARISSDALTEGTVQARIDVGAVRASVGAFGVPFGALRESIEQTLEQNADLNSECSYSDNTCEADSEVMCDAMSGALGFESVRATFGGVRPAIREDGCSI